MLASSFSSSLKLTLNLQHRKLSIVMPPGETWEHQLLVCVSVHFRALKEPAAQLSRSTVPVIQDKAPILITPHFQLCLKNRILYMHRNSSILHTSQNCETEKYVMGPAWPKTKSDYAAEGQQQITRPAQVIHISTLNMEAACCLTGIFTTFAWIAE
jgi:hypothetical protein